MEIRNTSLLFAETEGEGPISASTTITFPRSVQRAAAGVTGYTARFEDNDDHHLGRLQVAVQASVSGADDKVVDITGSFLLRDWSEDIDDPYSGLIDLAVFAELAPITPPVPGAARPDLIVTGIETSQVIQHFRSAGHLGAPNVFPDNSIRLIADKATVVRVYTDYDASSRLPPIALLSGELVVTGNGSTMTIPSLENIVPRRDSSIERGIRNHTLNFIIPKSTCRGNLTLQVNVTDAADSTQFAASFERTAMFELKPTLPIMAVGITYTGSDKKDGATAAELAAPTMADFVNVFEFTETVFPISRVDITSYVEIDYDEETESDISDGCDKLQKMRDTISDLRGDSDDLIYGLYNVGVETGSVGGCGGGGAGVGRIGAEGTAAHEMGHAVGRKHAPCDNVVRCALPKNTDENYPNYVGFDSDSIGEFGVDPLSALANVMSPFNRHDFMGYSGGLWVSPYTYKALMSAVPNAVGAGASFANAAATSKLRRDSEWIPLLQEKLFLRLDIARDDTPLLSPSFHFPARPQRTGSIPTDYSLVFLDKDGVELASTCLLADESGCGCSGSSGPTRIRQAVRFPDGACRILLYKCDNRVSEWPIPHSPNVEVDVSCDHRDDDRPAIVVDWKPASKGYQSRTDDQGLWALVQWRDRFGVWRGCAARTQERLIRIPRVTFVREREIVLRVLVTEGIATGVGYWSGRCDHDVPNPYQPQIVLRRATAATGRINLSSAPHAEVVGAAGDLGSIRWHNDSGAELARGSKLPFTALHLGQQVVRATVVGSSDQIASQQWLLERTADDRVLLLQGDLEPQPEIDPDDSTGDHDHSHDSDSHHHRLHKTIRHSDHHKKGN